MCSSGNGILPGIEGLLRQPHHHRGVLADGIQHHRALELRGHFADDVDALGFEGAQMGQGSRSWVSVQHGCYSFYILGYHAIMTKSIGLAGDCGAWRAGAGRRHLRRSAFASIRKFLSSDLLEGRGVGQRGGDLATEYIATQFALAGREAGGRQRHVSSRTCRWSASRPSRTPTLSGHGAAARRSTSNGGDDFVGVSQTQQPETQFEGEAVFVGHGIAAPEFNWDDYKGVDVTGKILVLFTNEPPSTDPKFFDGRALTYYGRWTYKYEEALRHGARGRASSSTPRRRPAMAGTWCAVPGARETPYVKLAPGRARRWRWRAG